jgi:ATP-binding cassette subfamily B protein
MDAEGAFHQEKSVGKVYDLHLFRRLLARVAPYWRLASVAIVLIILSAFLQLVGPLTLAITIDLFAPSVEGLARHSTASQWVAGFLADRGLEPSPLEGVGWMAAVNLTALLFSFLVLYLQSYVMQLMGQRIMYDLRRDVFGRLQRLPVSFLDQNPIGRLVTRATTDIGALNELFTAGLVSIFGDIFFLVGIVTVLFALDWRLALVSFAVLPLLFSLTLWFKAKARHSYRAVRVKVAAINSFLQEHITGMGVVQLFGGEKRAYEEFDVINRDHRDFNVKAIFYYAIYYPSVEVITVVGLALIVWYGGGRTIQGALSLGALVAFLQYAQRFYQPLADLSEKYNILQSAMASGERIFDLLDTETEIVSPPDAFNPSEVKGRVELDRVVFAYKPGEPVLRDVSFTIREGETVAVVGHTGAGKSTLANLMLRFYDVGEGSVSIDGVDVRQWDLSALRGAITVVLQDVVLFAGDVAGNIRLGATEISDERLRWAAGEVHALGFIDALPQGFATPVRERGAGLSVGQKQLIAFARALAADPRILILDEATASIDTETEQKIQEALDRLLVGRTSLVIAHRLSTIQKADRILVLHKGRLAEQGTHQELLDLGGIYKKLYELQFEQEPLQAAVV